MGSANTKEKLSDLVHDDLMEAICKSYGVQYQNLTKQEKAQVLRFLEDGGFILGFSDKCFFSELHTLVNERNQIIVEQVKDNGHLSDIFFSNLK